MNWRSHLETVVSEVRDLLSTLKEEEVEAFLALLEEYRQKRIFFWARGRSFSHSQGFCHAFDAHGVHGAYCGGK